MIYALLYLQLYLVLHDSNVFIRLRSQGCFLHSVTVVCAEYPSAPCCAEKYKVLSESSRTVLDVSVSNKRGTP